MADTLAGFDFSALVAAIKKVHEHLAAQAGRAVNIGLTLRNWVIGAYIAEYELHGADRATYGDSLLTELAKRLTGLKISNCSKRQLYRYIRFYRLYPEIVGTPSPQSRIHPDKLIHRLSYSHFELIPESKLNAAEK